MTGLQKILTNDNNTNTTTNNNNVESWEMAHQGRVLAGQA